MVVSEQGADPVWMRCGAHTWIFFSVIESSAEVASSRSRI